jgi:UDPglucose 6-dehydrogenase
MSKLQVGVIGAGYVGLTTAVCLAHKGFDTICVDNDGDRVAHLGRGVPVIDEPQLDELLGTGLDLGVLRFTTEYRALSDRDVVFICVPTPTNGDGSADLRAVQAAVDRLVGVLKPDSVVAVKSTVPVGTCSELSVKLAEHNIHTVANPEFLREGHAIFDFEHPDRVVIGTDDQHAADVVAGLYAGDTDEILRMSPESAELAKYASNAFLAVKLSYVNSIAQLCAQVGADISDVTCCMGKDERIGRQFLAPGPGWGGSCLPKDTAALVQTGRRYGVPLREIESARKTNAAQCERIIATLHRMCQRAASDLRMAAFGLTFKAGTSDTRDSPAMAICTRLQRLGAQITAYDPRLDTIDRAQLDIATAGDPYVAAKDADAILVLTEWPEFAELDWASIAKHAGSGAVVIDTRNLLDPNVVRGAKLAYVGNGTASGY